MDCIKCLYAEAFRPNRTILCRRNPPQVILVRTGLTNEFHTVWPEVQRGDYCHEFKAGLPIETKEIA